MMTSPWLGQCQDRAKREVVFGMNVTRSRVVVAGSGPGDREGGGV